MNPRLAADRKGATVAERLAAWATQLTYDELPAKVIDAAKILMIDQLGLQLRGSTLPHVQPQRKLVQAMAAAPEAVIVNSGASSAVALAAYVNGTCGHSMEFDDCHMHAWHASSVVVPAALAVGERHGATGKDLLLAVLVGHQLMSVIGTAMTPGLLAAGWHGSKVMGGFAAAASAARLMNLSALQLAHAFAIAGNNASGTVEYDRSGGEVKRQYAGLAARSGIESAQLAGLGLTGPLTIFEGPRGISRLFAGTSDLSALQHVQERWHILDTCYRLNPGVGTILAPLDIVAALQTEHCFDWRDVESVKVGLPEFAVEHGGHIVHPHDGLSAHFSLAFSLALRLVMGNSAPQHYLDPAKWNDPDIAALARKVEPHAAEFCAGAPLLSAVVRIRLRDGRELSREQGGFRGHTVRPASEDDIVSKYRANVSNVLPADRAEELLNLLRTLDDASELTRLTQILRNDP